MVLQYVCAKWDKQGTTKTISIYSLVRIICFLNVTTTGTKQTNKAEVHGILGLAWYHVKLIPLY